MIKRERIECPEESMGCIYTGVLLRGAKSSTHYSVRPPCSVLLFRKIFIHKDRRGHKKMVARFSANSPSTIYGRVASMSFDMPRRAFTVVRCSCRF